MPGGETFVRQMQYGKGYYRDKLGVDVTAGWLIDSFGHHAQMPQLLVKAGYKTFWFVRGVPAQDHPAEFLWEGIDGTRIASFYLPHSYAILYGAPRDAAGVSIVGDPAVQFPVAECSRAGPGRSHGARRQRAGGPSDRAGRGIQPGCHGSVRDADGRAGRL